MAAAGSSKASLASDDESTIKVAPKKESKPKSNGVKLKKPPPKHSLPGNWRDGSVIDDDKKKGPDTPSSNSVPASPGPIVNPLEDSTRESFATGRPLDDKLEIIICKHCKKSVLRTSAQAHIEACLKAKKDKAQKKKEQKEARDREKRREAGELKDKDEDGDTRMGSDDDDDPDKKSSVAKSTNKSAGKKVALDDNKKGKKRKADGEAEKGPKQKKKKEEPKPKVPKQRGPVDVERQCGVMKDGVPCARSLTCKSHSMGAKRAVAGRSLPYDMLLAAYQKKNQAKQQKAAIDANAPLEDDDDGGGPIDSDEELTAVLNGLANWNPQPVVPPLIQIPIERKYQKERLREQLMNATNGFTINIFKVKGLGAQTISSGYAAPGMDGEGDADGDSEMEGAVVGGVAGSVNGVNGTVPSAMSGVAARRASGFNMQMPPQRKMSSSQR